MSDIAVLRGGEKEFSISLSEGQEILKSLSKIGYKPIDVLVDRAGNWTVQGVPTDAHAIFTRAHTVVDTTRDIHAAHVSLARRMGVTLFLSRGQSVRMDREDMYRLLRMQGFTVPDTTVVRAKASLKDSVFREVWSKSQIPLMVRPLVRTEGVSSKLINSYPEFETIVREYHGKGIDIHILPYRKVSTSSLAVLPHFRGEKLYTPVWVETFGTTHSLPSASHSLRAHLHAPDARKESMREIATKVYEALNLSGPACVDVIPYKDTYMVVNIDPTPSLRKNGRFMQSLSSTGVDLGQYIHAQIAEDVESSLYDNYELTR